MNIGKDRQSLKGEIVSMLALGSLLVIAVGAFLGSNMYNNLSLNSQAARKKTTPLSCPANFRAGPFSGRDCSGAASGGGPANVYSCDVRVIADTFNVTEDTIGGKSFFRIEGNFCFTNRKTSGGHKGFFYITNEHPGKRACIQTLATWEHLTYYPSDYPLCDQSGQWATLNPKGPIPDRFRGPGKQNFFSFLVEKPADGCLYMNYETNGLTGGGGAVRNHDVWNLSATCNKSTPIPTATPTISGSPSNTPQPSISGGPSLTPTPSPTGGQAYLVCNEICTGAGQCGKLKCTETNGELRCRREPNLSDPTCGGPTNTPTPSGPTGRPTSTPTPTDTITSTPGVVACSEVCNSANQCPTDLRCHEVGTQMLCRRPGNLDDPQCGYPSETPTPTGPGTCLFFPVSFIFEQLPDGSFERKISPDKDIWGSLNNKMLDEVTAMGRNEKQFLKDWNNTTTGQPKGFDAFGEYNPCKIQNGGVSRACVIKTPYCCGYPKDEIDSGASEEMRNYNIMGPNGENAQVKLFYDDSQYDVVQQCFNEDENSPSKDAASCNISVKGRTDPEIFKDPRLLVKCGEAYRYGWVLRRNNLDGSCPLLTDSCKPKNIQADIRNGSATLAEIKWDYPTGCTGLREITDQFWIDIVDQNGRVVCTKSVKTDTTDTITTCKLGKEKSRPELTISDPPTSWDGKNTYHAVVYSVRSDDSSCRIGAVSNNFSKPGDGDDGNNGGNERRSHQLDLWENGSQPDDCYIAADTASGINAKQADHCKVSRNPTSNGLDELIAEYTNKTGRTLEMWYQMNSCDGKLLSELGGVCNGDSWLHRDRTFDLPDGKTIICTWTNPKRNPNISCQIHDIDSGGGNGNNNPTDVPSKKVIIKGTITIGSPVGVKVKRVMIDCEKGNNCPIQKNATIRGVSNVYDYSFDAQLNKTYTLRAFVEYQDQNGLIRSLYSYGNDFTGKVEAKDEVTIKNYTVDIPDNNAITNTITISGIVTAIGFDKIIDKINEVKVEFTPSNCVPSLGCATQISTAKRIGSSVIYSYSLDLPLIAAAGSSYSAQAKIIYKGSDNLPHLNSDPVGSSFRSIPANASSRQNFGVTNTDSPSTAVNPDVISVTYNIKNASKAKKINDLYTVICSTNTTERLVFPTYRAIEAIASGKSSNENCLRLDQVGTNFPNTSLLPNQQLTTNPQLIRKSYNGFALLGGYNYKIGCVFRVDKSWSNHCKLKDIKKGESIDQNITLTIGDKLSVN